MDSVNHPPRRARGQRSEASPQVGCLVLSGHQTGPCRTEAAWVRWELVRSWRTAAGDKLWVLPGWWVPRPASRAGWGAGELHTPPRAGRGRGGAEDLPRSSQQCIPQPTPRWRPAAVALTSAGQAERAQPRAREGGAPERPGTAATQRCGLVSSRKSQGKALRSCGRPGFPVPLQSAQTAHSPVRNLVPNAQPRALRAAAFYSPPAFVWVSASTTGCGGVQGRL